MKRLTQKDMLSLLACLRKVYAHQDLDSFAPRMVPALEEAISSEVTGYRELDAGGRTSRILLDPPEATFEGFEQRFSEHIHQYAILKHYLRTRDGRALKISDFLTPRQYRNLGLYRDVFRHVAGEHQMVAYLTAATKTIAIALNRSRRDFSERDRLVLNLLRPHVAEAYQNAKAVTDLRQQTAHLGMAMERLNDGVIVLTVEGRVESMSARARQWLADYFRGSSGQLGGLPDALERWVKHEKDSLRESSDVPPVRKPLVLERADARLVVRLVEDEDRTLLLLREERTALRPESLAPLGLSPREAEVLFWVAQGKTNVDVGVILGLSPLTVRTHLEHIYEKLGVETRTAAAAQAYEAAQAK